MIKLSCSSWSFHRSLDAGRFTLHSWIAYCKEVLALDAEIPVILMTAFGTVSSAVQAMKLGAFDYIQKPFEAVEIALLVDRAYQHRCLKADNDALRASLSDGLPERMLVGESRLMRELLRRCEQLPGAGFQQICQWINARISTF